MLMTIDDVRSENENFKGDGKENDKNRSGIEMRAFKTKMRTMVPMVNLLLCKYEQMN